MRTSETHTNLSPWPGCAYLVYGKETFFVQATLEKWTATRDPMILGNVGLVTLEVNGWETNTLYSGAVGLARSRLRTQAQPTVAQIPLGASRHDTTRHAI